MHYNQHGLLLLQGQGIYRLADRWCVPGVTHGLCFSSTHHRLKLHANLHALTRLLVPFTASRMVGLQQHVFLWCKWMFTSPSHW